MIAPLTALRVVARLGSPLAGDPPRLDGLLERLAAPTDPRGQPAWRIDRNNPAPPPGAVAIPVRRTWVDNHLVAHCSCPILGASLDQVEHYHKAISSTRFALLAEAHRKPFASNAGWTKSYRLPLRIRLVREVAWFALGHLEAMERLLGGCAAIGKKTGLGYGRVVAWSVTAIAEDWSWFAPSDGGRVLMATLPEAVLTLGGDREAIVGFRRDFAACSPPYWHPERYAEVITPC